MPTEDYLSLIELDVDLKQISDDSILTSQNILHAEIHVDANE